MEWVTSDGHHFPWMKWSHSSFPQISSQRVLWGTPPSREFNSEWVNTPESHGGKGRFRSGFLFGSNGNFSGAIFVKLPNLNDSMNLMAPHETIPEVLHPFEDVFPIENGDISASYVSLLSLPEATVSRQLIPIPTVLHPLRKKILAKNDPLRIWGLEKFSSRVFKLPGKFFATCIDATLSQRQRRIPILGCPGQEVRIKG